MSSQKPPPYVLQELPDITDSINYPIKNVQRIKYTCFDVSKTLIVFGATSGGLYIFNRTPCEFLQLIPNKVEHASTHVKKGGACAVVLNYLQDGAVTRLAISSDDKHIGYANGRGTVTVTGCKQSPTGGHSTTTSKDHQGNEVTAMIWNDNNLLFSGDDVGKLSVLQMQNFIAKTFQSSSQIIMSLDSRICQIDTKSCMLLVSTLTRCYICDTSQEQYRQIGQKLRDGEFGACFVNKQKYSVTPINKVEKDFTEVKRYNMVNEESKFAVGKELENTIVFCARPSSRLWEAAIDGAVKRTHQFKQVLARKPMKIVTLESYDNENLCIENIPSCDEGKSINFFKIFSMKSVIFCFRKDALFFLNIENVDHTVWFEYKDILDCKLYSDMLYLWLNNGSLLSFRFTKIDKFLIKSYIDEKYAICADLCAFYRDYLLTHEMSPKLHILSGLRDKLEHKDILNCIDTILDKFDSLKSNTALQKFGIHVVDNTYHAQSSLDEEDNTKHNNDYKFNTTISPEAMQALKDIGVTVSDKLNTSKKMLKEKWEDFEDKMKHLGDKPDFNNRDIRDITRDEPKLITHEEPISILPTDINIVYKEIKESSQKAIDIENLVDKDKVSKSLYQCYKLSLVGKADQANLISIIENNSCDIKEIYSLMTKLEQYCVDIGSVDESKYVPNHIFLTFLNSTKLDENLDLIIKDEELYKYFVDSCISVNIKTLKNSNTGCECGFPLPYARTNQTPVFSELIDKFIEMQWSGQTKDQCYDMCKRMPYLWRKILYLRRNEDLLNILRILLQMLDEKLLHSFLPQFTIDTWNRAVQLYATLYANMCLNCAKKFENISVKDMLSWDDLGVLMIKSIGGRNAIKIMEKNANLIDAGAITMKFYHTCLVVTMFEKFDSTVVVQLTDTLYGSYEYEDARKEIFKLLRNNTSGCIKNTALPISVAATSPHWGLTPLKQLITENDQDKYQLKHTTLKEIIDNLYILTGVTDCSLCGIPLENEFLIQDGGLWVFQCGHTYHGACLELNKVRLCVSCVPAVSGSNIPELRKC